MAKITIGSRTLNIPQARETEAAKIIKEWMSLKGTTPKEILDALSNHYIGLIKAVLIDRIGSNAYRDDMTGSKDAAKVVKEAAETKADGDFVLS